MRFAVMLMLLSGCTVSVETIDCATDCGVLCDWNESCIQRQCAPKKRALGCRENAIPPDQQADP